MELCQQKITLFASRNAILFQSGSATITGESLPALDELASYLELCPAAAVHIEGHTDADGDDTSNLALSIARAEAVVARLSTTDGVGAIAGSVGSNAAVSGSFAWSEIGNTTEAVVAALIERGVGFERLYAIGYGESLPVADNDTIAGKQANRRIAFTIVEGQT